MSGISILQVAHDHPDWTPGRNGDRRARPRPGARRPRRMSAARFLAAATALQRPGAAPGSLGAHGDDFVLHTGAYDRFSMTRLDGHGWMSALERVLDDGAAGHRAPARARPDRRRDRAGGPPACARCRIVLTLHDYQLICPNDGLLLTTGEGARCRGAQPDRCRRCFPELGAARHALRRAHLLAAARERRPPSSRRAPSCATASSTGASTPTASRWCRTPSPAPSRPADSERPGRGGTASPSSATSRGTRARWCCSTPPRA